MNIKTFNNKIIKSTVLLIFVVSNLWLLIGVCFISPFWWWFSLFIIILGGFVLFLHKDIVFNNTIWNKRLIYVLPWLIIYSFLIVIIGSIWITPYWSLGMILMVGYIALYFSLIKTRHDQSNMQVERRIIALSISSVFVLTICLYSIPSIQANNHINPRESFSSTYNAMTTYTYTLYGSGNSDTEHVVAQSWNPNDSQHYVNDYVNVIRANQVANNQRGNLPFGNVKKTIQTSIYDGNVIVGYKNSTYFMPTDEFKGDIARIILYMYITYHDDGFSLHGTSISLMKKWSSLDPVDNREEQRNNLIQSNYEYHNKLVSSSHLVRFVV